MKKKKQKENTEPIILSRYTRKNVNNFGELCRQEFKLIGFKNDIKNQVLGITKIVYTDRFKLYDAFGFIMLREFKGKRVYKQIFSVKMDSLNDAFKYFNNHT